MRPNKDYSRTTLCKWDSMQASERYRKGVASAGCLRAACRMQQARHGRHPSLHKCLHKCRTEHVLWGRSLPRSWTADVQSLPATMLAGR